jgi:uncharacterized protein YbjT (DUF2867 family)
MSTPAAASSHTSRLVLITGATGRQGGAAARSLLARGVPVRALTRSPSSAPAGVLAALGAEIVQGDLDDAASLTRAMDGVSGVFSVQDPWAHGVAREVEQGTRLADVARQAGVRHFVYGSVACADQPTGVPHFESKGRVERHIQAIGLPATIIRPVFFMELLLPTYDKARYVWGMLGRVLGRAGRVQLTSARDIGHLAADAFTDPDAHVGRVLELAAEELRYEELVATYRSAFGKKPASFSPPLAIVGLFDREAATNFRWIGRHGWHLDLAAQRARYPWMTDFKAFLAAHHLPLDKTHTASS